MERHELLKQMSFGARVAEDEVTELARYFVETDQWSRIFNGDVDIIRGEKGAGKSAIYSLLLARNDKLFFAEFYSQPLNGPAAQPSSVI
jgi:hypothetical protein